MERAQRPLVDELDGLRWGRLEDWIQLVRLPNIFTLLSNCLVASVIAVGGLQPLSTFIPVLVASILAYWAGMILNDVADQDEDRLHRPDRPIASGRISADLAGHIATAMLIAGPLLVVLATSSRKPDTVWLLASLVCSVLLWAAIRGYNSPLKHTLLGPLLMGGCRALNILMVGYAMLAVHWAKDFSPVDRFPNTLVAYALAVGVFILGVTIYARREEQTSSQATLLVGGLFQLLAFGLFALLPRQWVAGRVVNWSMDANIAYPVLIGLFALTVLNRSVAGLLHPVPRKVQLAVKYALLWIILIDAAILWMWVGPWYAAALAVLLLPALAGSFRWRTT